VKTRSINGSSGKKKVAGSKKSSSYSPDNSDMERGTAVKVAAVPYSSTPENGPAHSKRHHLPLRDIGNDSLNRSAEMMEIDARLSALQKFMKENMP